MTSISERRQRAAQESWKIMTDLVMSDARRRDVCAQVGLSFGKLRTLHRVAQESLTMGELATLLVVDPPNLTPLVDDLERRGLVTRRIHPTDRRAKLVVATRSGAALAGRAQRLLNQPPDEMGGLSVEDLETLRRILRQVQSTNDESAKGVESSEGRPSGRVAAR